MIPVPLVALINACLIDMALKIELRIEYMLRILYICSDSTATSDPFKNTDRWIIASFLWETITCMACLLLNCIFHWYIKKLSAAISRLKQKCKFCSSWLDLLPTQLYY